MTRLILVRHGESEANASGRLTGQMDVPLTALGVRQAEETARALAQARIDAAYASDLIRAYETGRIIAAPHGLTVQPVKALRELDMGQWQGQMLADLALRPDFQAWRRDRAHMRCAGGESYGEMFGRVTAACDMIARREAGKTALVAAHAGAVRCMLLLCRGQGVDALDTLESVENASARMIVFENGLWKEEKGS